MSEPTTEITTSYDGTTTIVDLYVHAETPAERAMRLSNVMADFTAGLISGAFERPDSQPIIFNATLVAEIADALAEYSHLLAYVGASLMPSAGAGPTGGDR